MPASIRSMRSISSSASRQAWQASAAGGYRRGQPRRRPAELPANGDRPAATATVICSLEADLPTAFRCTAARPDHDQRLFHPPGGDAGLSRPSS